MHPGALPALHCMHPQESCQERTRVSLNTERKKEHQLVWQRRWTQLLCTGLWGLRLKAEACTAVFAQEVGSDFLLSLHLLSSAVLSAPWASPSPSVFPRVE